MIAGLVLAAGSSTRLGSPKQLATIEGRPMLQHVIDRAREGGLEEIVVVVGHAANDIRREIRLPAGTRLVVNPAHATGQGSSLLAGFAALDPEVRAAVVLLGDQPDVGPSVIRRIADRYRAAGGPVVRARYGGLPGHPVLIDRRLWSLTASPAEDRGAGPVLSSRPDWVTWVDVDAPPPQEVDTAEDLERVRARGLAADPD